MSTFLLSTRAGGGAGAAGHPLGDDLGVFVYEDGHFYSLLLPRVGTNQF